jgi:hypothetical protein
VNYVPWANISLKQSNDAFVLSTEFIVVAVVLELLNAMAINALFFVPRNVMLFDKVEHSFSNDRFAFICMVLAVNLYINPLYAFLDVPDYY